MGKIITVRIWKGRSLSTIPKRKKGLEAAAYCLFRSVLPISLLTMKSAFQTAARSIWTAYWVIWCHCKETFGMKTKWKKKRNEKKAKKKDQSRVRMLWKAQQRGDVLRVVYNRTIFYNSNRMVRKLPQKLKRWWQWRKKI